MASGAALELAATGTSNPDGNAVEYRWWQYVEAGTLATNIVLENATAPKVWLVVPRVIRRETIHLILWAT